MALWHFVRNAARFAAALHWSGTDNPRAPRPAQPVPIFVINLERSEQRRRFIVSHLRKIGLHAEILNAVDGRALDLEELERTGVYQDAVAREKFSRSLTPAEIGCSLSHLHAYEKVVNDGIDMALVLEDDAMFTPDIAARLTELLQELPRDWDIVHLIYACRDYDQISPRVVRFTMKPTMPVAATAYLISRGGAEKMIQNAQPIRYPADSFIGRSPRWGTAVYGAKPQLAEINNIFPSAIARDRGAKSKISRKLREVVVRLLD